MRIEINRRKIEAKISQAGDRAMKGMSAVMRRRAILIRDLARSYAPRRTQALERSIDYVTLKESRRNVYVVYIDYDRKRNNGRGSVGDYARKMERELAPYGQGKYDLGPISRAKSAAGHKVGGRFFARAVAEGTRLLKEEARAAAKGKSFQGATANPAFRSSSQTARSRSRKRKNRRNS